MTDAPPQIPQESRGPGEKARKRYTPSMLAPAPAPAPVSPEVLAALRADLPAVIAGIFLSGLAVVVGALTLALRRGGDRTQSTDRAC